MARCISAEGDLPRRLRLEHQQRHAPEHPALEALLERMQPDLHVRVLPQQHVVLEVHRRRPIERHVQDRDELALESIPSPGAVPSVIWVGRICGAVGMVSSPFVADRAARRRTPARTVPGWAALSRFAGMRCAARAIIAACRTIYVTGHRNPDTDSIASAIGYAELKRRLDPRNEYVPVRLGDCNPQTRWLLERSGAPEPELLPHVMLRAVRRDEARLSRSPAQEQPIREAGLAMARAQLELVPVVDDDGALAGVVDRARARPPLHPRIAPDLDARGGADLRPARSPRSSRASSSPARTGAGRPGLGAFDGRELTERHLGRRHRGDRQPRGRPAAGHRARRRAARASPTAPPRPTRCSSWPREHGTAVIVSPLDTYVSARMITLAAPCRAFMEPEPLTVTHRRPGHRRLRADQGEPLRRHRGDRRRSAARSAWSPARTWSPRRAGGSCSSTTPSRARA